MKDTELTVNNGSKKLKIKIDNNNNAVGSGADGQGNIGDLTLNAPGKSCKIVSIPDGTIIETESCSPGCRWVFWGGQWWYVC